MPLSSPDLTFIRVTQSQEEAMALADLVVVMEGGRILQAAPPREVLDRPATAFVARLLLGGFQRQQKERGKPVLAHVVLGDVLAPGLQVSDRGVTHWLDTPIRPREGGGQVAPAPSAAEIQAVQVSEPAVAPVAHRDGLEEGLRFLSIDAREKASEPSDELR